MPDLEERQRVLEEPPDAPVTEATAASLTSALESSDEGGGAELDALIREVAALPKAPRFDVARPVLSSRKARRTSAELDELQPGTLIGDRYRIVELIGRGGMGSVYSADDGGERVAVKLIECPSSERRARVRREVAALRRLAAPGLVRLRDEGEQQEYAYLVMDLVHGEPFAGAERPMAWEALAGPALELLTILGRVHAQGIVHRDLKPGNVLVADDGSVTLLDFGLAADESARLDRLTNEDQLLGTPGFMAPEQILGGALTPATDLFAVGLMLFDALTGERPHGRGIPGRQLYARLNHDAPRLTLPGLPDVVRDGVAALLARDPRQRPQNAAAAAAWLSGQPSPAAALPRLGDAELPARVAALLDAGQSVDVLGEVGSGRTRLLQDVSRELGARRTILRASRGDLPFSALIPLLDAQVLSAEFPAATVADRVEAALLQRLAQGGVLVVDDADELDLASRHVIARLASSSTVLRAMAGPAQGSPAAAIRLDPLSREALGDLFVGPGRLFHLPSDAARLLHARTRGIPGRIAHELGECLANGLCQLDGARVRIERNEVERLDAGLVRFDRPLPRASAPLKANLEVLLGWIVVAGAEVSMLELAAATEMPLWRVQAEIDELAEAGFVKLHADAKVEPLRVSPNYLDTLDRARRHKRLAAVARAHSPAMVTHTFAAGYETDGELCDTTHAMLAHASLLARRGRLAAAIAILSEHLRCIDRTRPPAPALVEQILTLWARIALSDLSAAAMDRVLYELCRAGSTTGELHDLEALVRAALSLDQWGERIAALTESVPRFEDAALERLRQAIRVAGARRTSLAREEALLEELRAWAEASAKREDHAAFQGWLGRLRYRQERFQEAAELHVRAARGSTWATDRGLAQLNAASALLEQGEHGAAAKWAQRARRLARRSRHPFLEARAEWILRSCGYRSGTVCEPDRELVDAVEVLGVRTLTTMVALTEAAIAWRHGRHDAARQLADIAHSAGRVSGGPLGSVLAAALAVACGEAPDEPEITRRLDAAVACTVPMVSAQALALLRRAGVSVPAVECDKALRRLRDLADTRVRDVLSPHECATELGA
ncbi:MAG: serine/threonine-protein kinase [Polyangiaceae bacterium]